MNNRLSIPDIAGLLIEYTGKDKKSAELFLKEFTAVVTQGLFTDKIVKITGIGTFKIIPVEKRESVHVNTGERIVIPEHFKFSFTPDKNLREEVNTPFSLFETIELTDDTGFTATEPMPEEVKTAEVKQLSIEKPKIPAKKKTVAEKVSSVKEEIKETEKSNHPPETIHIPDSDPEKIILVKEVEEEISQPVSRMIPENSAESQPEVVQTEIVKETIPESEPVVEPEKVEEQNQTPLQTEKVSPPIYKEVPKPKAVEGVKRVNPTQPPRKKSYMRAILACSLIIVVSVIWFVIYTNSDFANSKDSTPQELVAGETKSSSPESEVENIQEENIPEASTVADWNVQESEIALGEDNSATTPEPEPVPFQEVIDKVKIKPGSRLTTIAEKYYGWKVFWVYIYEYNKDIIANPNNIPIGTELSIPAPEVYGIDFNDKKSKKEAELMQAKLQGK